jgi:hypothetical protein
MLRPVSLFDARRHHLQPIGGGRELSTLAAVNASSGLV